jgi:hypothetical protein
MGGSSRFKRSQLDAVATAALYSDTVLLPDPVMPWLETDRSEEQFRHVLLLEAVHALLQLKPLVDADLPYPAVVVFPSWEKSLEERDDETQRRLVGLLTEVVACVMGEDPAGFGGIVAFTDRHAERFCKAVDRNRLFVAPGGPIDEPLAKAMDRYERELTTWRTQEWLDAYHRLPSIDEC